MIALRAKAGERDSDSETVLLMATMAKWQQKIGSFDVVT